MKPKIDVIVINWNAGQQLKQCVDSVYAFSSATNTQIIIIDNGSTDNSTDCIEPSSSATVIRAGANLGFGKACNLGAQLGSSEYLLFLNPDAALYADTLSKAITFMQSPSNARVGICGVQLKNESGYVARSCTRFPHALSFVAHALGLDRFFPQLGHFMTEWSHDRTRMVAHVIGAFFLVRRSLFEELGGFDERFFVYLEDLDFSLRAHMAGWKTVYLADAQAFHAGGGTSNQVKARRLFYSLRSRLLYANKHFSTGETGIVLLATLLVEPFSRTAYAVLRGSWASIEETWSGYAMLYSWLPQWVLRGVTR